MLENKVPSVHGHALRAMSAIIDALKRDNLTEGQRYAADVMVDAQNEIDWCYRTDFVAPYILEFFMQVGDTIECLRHLHGAEKRELLRETIATLQDALDQQPKITEPCATWDSPDARVDALEIGHRNRIYGRKA